MSLSNQSNDNDDHDNDNDNDPTHPYMIYCMWNMKAALGGRDSHGDGPKQRYLRRATRKGLTRRCSPWSPP